MNPNNQNSENNGLCPKCGKRLYEGVSKGNWSNCPYKCQLEGLPLVSIPTPVATPVASRGLGDVIEKGINAIAALTGLTGVVEGIKKKGCGCDKRKKQLNKLLPL